MHPSKHQEHVKETKEHLFVSKQMVKQKPK